MNKATRRLTIAAGTLAVSLATASASFPAPASAGTSAGTAARHATAAPAYSPPRRLLTDGERGPDVKALQKRLNALHYFAGPDDGRFGQDTLEAVWAFQEVQGIRVDGIVGPATARHLARPRAYSPRDPRGGADRVEVNLTRQTLVLYKNHSVALISHVSPAGGYRFCDKHGCQTATTPTGAFRTTGYLPGWVKVPLGKMYNPVFFIGDEYAIHGDTDVPLGKASHGCIRIPMDIAQFFHTKVSAHGTPVYVFRRR